MVKPKISAELFLMTHCPYGDEALQKLLRISQNDDILSTIQLRYIIYDLRQSDNGIY